ncbi:unnamed protein product, partial [Thlaspi arvense]
VNTESERERVSFSKKAQEEPSTIKVSSLTCIDLANSDLHQSAALLKQACLDCAFFYVINHSLSEELKNEAFEQSKKFFALPLEEKMKVLRNGKNQRYSPVLDQILDPENQGITKRVFSLESKVQKMIPMGINHSIAQTLGLTLMFCPLGVCKV